MADCTTIPAFTNAAVLKRKLRAHLAKLGFTKSDDGALVLPDSSKDVIRKLHSAQRIERLEKNRKFIEENYNKLIDNFASGTEVDPNNIVPKLERVRSNTKQADLFRFAALTWSVPVSNGFGRRLRYLVRDTTNNKLIGLIAIGDPVFNLSVRDKLIGWTSEQRGKRLACILDAYVLGALPPYNQLLGGKLVASLLRTQEIYNDFSKCYGKKKGIISGKNKHAKLLAITTSSSMGRSSVYNRVKLGKTAYLRPIGFTGGWGHFHIPDKLFTSLREYLREIKHPYADLHSYGEGPNWRLRTIRAALDALGFKADMLKHGIQREVFLCEMAGNSIDILKTGKGEPDTTSLLNVQEVSNLAINRWMKPRALNNQEYRAWKKEQILTLLNMTALKSFKLKKVA